MSAPRTPGHLMQLFQSCGPGLDVTQGSARRATRGLSAPILSGLNAARRVANDGRHFGAFRAFGKDFYKTGELC